MSINRNDGKITMHFPRRGLLPPGLYTVTVASVKERVSAAGNDCLCFTLQVEDEPYAGQTLWDQAAFLEQTVWKFQTILEALTGHPWEGELELPDFDELVGLRCLVGVTEDEYEGQLRNKVARWVALPDVPPLTAAA